MITFEELMHVIAVSLQLSGAELLIINYWRKPFRQLAKEEADKEPQVKGNLINFHKRSESEISENIMLNRIAFLMIATGYLVGIFGNNLGHRKWWIFLYTLSLSALFTFIAITTAKKINK